MLNLRKIWQNRENRYLSIGYGRRHQRHRRDDIGWVSKGVLTTYYCREIFHGYDNRAGNGTMIFKGSLEGATRLLRNVENKIGVLPKNRAKFRQTTLPGWIEVRPGWWGDEPMRFSLFTILLRASRSNTTISGALRCKYLRTTRKAFRAFLEGRINYIGGTVTGYSGWGSVMEPTVLGDSCLINDAEKKAFETLKRENKKFQAIAETVQRLGNRQEAIMYHLTKVLV